MSKSDSNDSLDSHGSSTKHSQESRIKHEKLEDISQHQRKETFQEQAKNAFRRTTKKMEEFYSQPTFKNERLLVYLLLGIAIFTILFYSSFIGQLILGVIFGYYFTASVISYMQNAQAAEEGEEQFRYTILTATLLGIFILAPGIFIGAAILVAFKQFSKK